MREYGASVTFHLHAKHANAPAMRERKRVRRKVKLPDAKESLAVCLIIVDPVRRCISPRISSTSVQLKQLHNARIYVRMLRISVRKQRTCSHTNVIHRRTMYFRIRKILFFLIARIRILSNYIFLSIISFFFFLHIRRLNRNVEQKQFFIVTLMRITTRFVSRFSSEKSIGGLAKSYDRLNAPTQTFLIFSDVSSRRLQPRRRNLMSLKCIRPRMRVVAHKQNGVP